MYIDAPSSNVLNFNLFKYIIYPNKPWAYKFSVKIISSW